MKIESIWNITWDLGGAKALPILAVGDFTEEEITFPWAQQVDDNPRLRAPGLQVFGRGNVNGGMSFTTRRKHDGQLEAREWIFDHMLRLNDRLFLSSTLTVSMAGSSRVFSLADAVIQAAPTRIMERVLPITTSTNWSITGSIWTQLP